MNHLFIYFSLLDTINTRAGEPRIQFTIKCHHVQVGRVNTTIHFWGRYLKVFSNEGVFFARIFMLYEIPLMMKKKGL